MPNLHCESCGQHVVAKVNADGDAYCPDCGYCPAAAARLASRRNWTQEAQDVAGGNDTSPVSGRMMDGERKEPNDG